MPSKSPEIKVGAKLKAMKMASFGLNIIGETDTKWIVTHMFNYPYKSELDKSVIQLNIDEFR